MLTLLLTALASRALASETILMAPFYTSDASSTKVGDQLTTNLEDTLATGGDYVPMRVQHSLLVGKMNALNYLQGCGASGFIPCLFIVGGEVEAQYAVSGIIHLSPTGTSVSVTVLDVKDRKLLQTGTFDVAIGADLQLADSVTQFIRTAIAEGPAQPQSNRPALGPGDSPAALSHALDALPTADETIGSEPVATMSQDKTTYNLSPLAEGGGGAWEKLGYDENDWADYQASGLSMDEWRVRKMGHAGQVLLRLYSGATGGPLRETYYHRHAYDKDGSLADSYTAEASQPGVGPVAGVELAYGVTPTLDIGVSGRWAPGTVSADLVKEDGRTGEQILLDVPAAVWSIAPRAELSFRPTKHFHPALGAGFALHRLPTIGGWLAVNQIPDAEALPTHWLGYLEVWPGAQLELNRRVELYGRLPIGVHVLGSALQEERISTSELLTVAPPQPWAWGSVSAEVGLQFRMGGRKPAPIPTVLIEAPTPAGE